MSRRLDPSAELLRVLTADRSAAARIAAACGVSRQQVHRWARKMDTPGIRRWAKIEVATGGKIKQSWWVTPKAAADAQALLDSVRTGE